MSAKTIEKRVRRELHFTGVKLKVHAKAEGGSSGEIEGYLAVWNNIDRQGEVMVPGCFLRSIKSQIPARKVKYMTRHFAHGGDVHDLIGTIVEAKEDDFGLWIRAELSSIPEAQKVRTLVDEKHLDSMSVGFAPIEWRIDKTETGESIVYHTECHLLEGTVTVQPANLLAEITGVKSVQDPANAPQGTENKATGSTAKAPAATAAKSTALTMKAEIERYRAELFLLEN
jgi:HK97 family phage prohead protease